MNTKYLMFAIAAAGFAVSTITLDVVVIFIVLVGSTLYWQNHKIELKLNRLLARRDRRD